MPYVREFWPIGLPSQTTPSNIPIWFPTEGAMDPTIRVAVFDGGCPDIPSLSKWVRCKEAKGLKIATEKGTAPRSLRHFRATFWSTEARRNP